MGMSHSNLKSEIDATSDFATRPTESNSVSCVVTRGALVTRAWWPLGRKYCGLAPSIFSTITAIVFFFVLTFLDVH